MRREPKNPTVRALRELLTLMGSRNGGGHVYDAEPLARKIAEAYGSNFLCDQQDPDSVLGYILDALQQEGVGLDFLRGVTEQRLKCEGCGFTNYRRNPFSVLHVPIETSRFNGDLLEFIQAGFRKKSVDEKCNNCSSRKCTIETSLAKSPDVLFVKPVRAANDCDAVKKSMRSDACLNTLVAESFFAAPSEEQTVYRLYGVIVRESVLNAHRFVAYVHKRGRWCFASDDFTCFCSRKNVNDVLSAYGSADSKLCGLRSTACMLVYRRATEGLIDTGNRRGINAVLQCLAETVKPSQLLARNGSGGNVTKELADVLSGMAANSGKAVNPKMFIDALGRLSLVSFTFEEDPDSTLSYIIEALDCDSSGFAGTQWQTLTARETRCSACDAKQTQHGKHFVLPVTVKRGGLLECIRQAFEEHDVKLCYECNGIRDMVTRLTITKMPMFLVIRLDRKGNESIGFPQWFNSRELDENLRPSAYELYGVIAVQQSEESVVAYTKTNGSWFHKEDTVITPCHWEDVADTYGPSDPRTVTSDSVAFMLWYRRVDEHLM